MKKCTILLGLVYVLLTGCAVQPLTAQKSQDMRNGNIAVGYLQLEKRIEYNELVYKVLWNEQRSQTAVFEGIWDIDANLSERLSAQLNEQGLTTPVGIQRPGAERLSEDLPRLRCRRVGDAQIRLRRETQP